VNLLLLEADELDGSRATVRGRRARHIAEIHRAAAGKTLRVGVLGGRIGSGVLVSVHPELVELDVALTEEPPPPLPCTLVLALPRPNVLCRVLAAAASFGIKRIVLIRTLRVEKSYWQSPAVGDDKVRQELLHGLEQGGDTVMPVVEKHQRFRPFVEDCLPALVAGSDGLVAHPGAAEACAAARGPVTLVVGPEGGLVDFELDLLGKAGLRCVSLGTRPLRVETAVAALLGRLF
jgi:RsmE family RNA methyltransferase